MLYDSKNPRALLDSILYQCIEDLPEDEAPCELDCRRVQCGEREWMRCRRRLRRFTDQLTPNLESDSGRSLDSYMRPASRSV
jgi:hypothetical protein